MEAQLPSLPHHAQLALCLHVLLVGRAEHGAGVAPLAGVASSSSAEATTTSSQYRVIGGSARATSTCKHNSSHGGSIAVAVAVVGVVLFGVEASFSALRGCRPSMRWLVAKMKRDLILGCKDDNVI